MAFATVDEKFTHSTLSDQAYRVYMALKHHCDKFGQCWPGVERLALLLNRKVRAIQRAIAELVEKGAAVVERRAHRTNVYRLISPEYQPAQPELFEGATAMTLKRGGRASKTTPPEGVEKDALLVSKKTPQLLSPVSLGEGVDNPTSKPIGERERSHVEPPPPPSPGRDRTEQHEPPVVQAVVENYQRLFPESRAANARKRLAELRAGLTELSGLTSIDPLRASVAMSRASADAAAWERERGRLEFCGLGGVDAALTLVLSDIGRNRRRQVRAA